jgi:hypothetical protein
MIDHGRSRITAMAVSAARAVIAGNGRLDYVLLDEVSYQLERPPATLRALFVDDESLLDAVNEQLVEECADRLQAALERLTHSGDAERDIRQFARVIAQAAPLDYAGLVFRTARRWTALRSGDGSTRAVAAESAVVDRLGLILASGFQRIGREPAWDGHLVARVLISTYERSFEAWILQGGHDTDFVDSAFIRRTLPQLLTMVSRPLSAE